MSAPLAAILVILALASAAPQFPFWPLRDQDIAHLRGGETLSRDFDLSPARGATIRFFVKADPPECYRILASVPDMPKYMPGLEAVRVVEDRGNVKILEYKSQVPLIADFTLQRHFEPYRRIWWTKVKAPYKRLDGEWAFIGVPGGTVLSYTLVVETGLVVPSWLAVQFQKQGSYQLVRNVRNRIESGGRWVRPDYGEAAAAGFDELSGSQSK